ncbi:phosphatidate cytidylyltransferase [Mesobaculum littorinae]|uniref:Phosphatidate cytidylyltransferase n=1 Tax=Mesobaculum littorinae TaxID=2486419 RepID=A0A438ALM3_9RHOB|nr:phosphatidate cytidylyltransferase [Mesobaculum littorinae]RVV99534.1 phosphatidate cytidylyltransferase [Mesobaculum littorinae]
MAVRGLWDDLLTRMGTGAVVALIGIAAIWAGGLWLQALTVLVAAVMVWELARMLDPASPALTLASVAGAALLVAEFVPPGWAMPLLVLPAMVGFGQLHRHRSTFTVFTLMIMLASYGLYVIRSDFGFIWLFWLVLVVIATDVFGYFAGRFIGGPKFWPRVSPKKTWAGTIAGWVAAAGVGVLFIAENAAGPQLIGISVAVSMASQIGDIAESAVKRRVGVKDSSSLLPGHGGLFDRFDGMLGASLFLLFVAQLVDFPYGLA